MGKKSLSGGSSVEANPIWEDNSIQFPRLIAEMEMAGAFTDDVIAQLRESMDLETDEIMELVSRACDEFDGIKEKYCGS